MIKIGVSACLLGIECAYNGSSKKDDFVCNSLSKFFDLVPFCPEDEILSHPRESMKLVIDQEGIIHAKGNKTNTDYTEKNHFLC